MTTKEQERKALEQIKKIVASLGENSYVGTALDGMIEDAEENIECDFALSWKDRAQTAEKHLSDLQTTYEKQVTELAAERNHAEQQRDEAMRDLDEAKEDLNFIIKKKNEYHSAMIDEANARAAAEQKVSDLESEIIKLKAKLYDMITKEVN